MVPAVPQGMNDENLAASNLESGQRSVLPRHACGKRFAKRITQFVRQWQPPDQVRRREVTVKPAPEVAARKETQHCKAEPPVEKPVIAHVAVVLKAAVAR